MFICCLIYSQELIQEFPDPPLEEVDVGVMKACRDSILTCLRYIHIVAQADAKRFIRLSTIDRFVIRVSNDDGDYDSRSRNFWMMRKN